MADGSVTTAPEPARLLLIDGAGALGDRLAAPLAEVFACAPVVVELVSGRQGLDVLRGSSFDVVAADLAAMADIAEAMEERISRLARAAAGAVLLVLAEDASISASLAAMRAGAHDCVCRTLEPAQMIARIGDLVRRHGKGRSLVRPLEPVAAGDVSPSPLPSIPSMRDLVLPMWRQEQRIIEDAIQSFAGNIALAAAALELSPSTIYRKRQAWAEMDGKRTA